jgi:hypothetical protein
MIDSDIVHVELTSSEIGLLLTGLAYFEKAVSKDRPATFFESMLSLRAKLVDAVSASSATDSH